MGIQHWPEYDDLQIVPRRVLQVRSPYRGVQRGFIAVDEWFES